MEDFKNYLERESYKNYLEKVEKERLERKRRIKKRKDAERKKMVKNLKVYGLTAILAFTAFKGIDSSKEIKYKYFPDAPRIEQSIDNVTEAFDNIYLFYDNDYEKEIAENTEDILEALGRNAYVEKLSEDQIGAYKDNYSDYFIRISSRFRNGTRSDEMSNAFNDYGLKDPAITTDEYNPFAYGPTEFSPFVPKLNNTYLGETVYVSKHMSEADLDILPKAIVSAIYKKEAKDPNAKFDIYNEMIKNLKNINKGKSR